MLRRVVLVWTDVSEEHSASFIRVTRIGELRKTLAVTNNRRTCVSECVSPVWIYTICFDWIFAGPEWKAPSEDEDYGDGWGDGE
jgi:hypothetical protein